DPAHARAGAGGRAAHSPAVVRGRRAAALLPHHAVRARGRASRGAPPDPDAATRARVRVRSEQSMTPDSRPPALFRALLRLYPASFRAEYGDELWSVFTQRRRDAGGPVATAVLLAATVLDTILSAARAHADITRQDVAYATRTLRRAPGFAIT